MAMRKPEKIGSFRKPVLNIDGDAAQEKNLLSFIRHCRQRQLFETDNDEVDLNLYDVENNENNNENEGGDVIIVNTQEEETNHETDELALSSSSSLASSSSITKTDENKAGIKWLEPHIAAFRKRMDDAEYDGSTNEDDDSCLASHIPLQLMRVIRFFPLKWVPLKRALLRRPSKNEVGKTNRLLLAKALHRKNLIATAEFDILEQSCCNIEMDMSSDEAEEEGVSSSNISGVSRKRRLDRDGISNELKMAFSRLPSDISVGNICSMRHLKSVLNEYNNQLNSKSKTGALLPTVEEVAEWALLSFCGVVVSNGLDEPRNKDSQQYSFESQLVILLTSENAQNDKVVSAVKKRIQQMLEPPTVDKLSNLNILCLARFLSYLEVPVTELLFAHAMIKNLSGLHRTGFTSLPKLLAAYLSIVMKRILTYSLHLLQSNVKKLTSQFAPRTEDINDRFYKLISVVFDLTGDLINTEATPAPKRKR